MAGFDDPAVAAAFAAFPEPAKPGLMRLRALILETAGHLPKIGRLEEALRWGQPAYLTPDTRSGSTLRLGMAGDGDFAIFAHCQSRVISRFAHHAPPNTRIKGNRAVLFAHADDIDPDTLRPLIRHALTYHKPHLAEP